MAAIDIAADLGCSLSELSERLPKKELTLWLARYMMKLGFTYDQTKIKKQRNEEFMERARAHWNK